MGGDGDGTGARSAFLLGTGHTAQLPHPLKDQYAKTSHLLSAAGLLNKC